MSPSNSATSARSDAGERAIGRSEWGEDLASHRCSAFRQPATGQALLCYLYIDGEIEHRHVTPTPSTDDTEPGPPEQYPR